METVDEIYERIWNPSPAVTHCPCGYALGVCVREIVSGGCHISDKEMAEFVKMMPEWLLRAVADLA